MSTSALLDRQQALGGVLVERVAGAPRSYRFCCPRVLHFGDATAEYQAVRTGVALLDVSDRRQIELAGRDARSFLHNFCTNDIKRLAAGDGCEAFVANVQGRILAHLFVFATDVSVWIEAGPGEDAPLVSHFERYVFHEDVQFQVRTAQLGQLLLTGPRSAEMLAPWMPAAAALELLQHAACELAGRPCVVRRLDLLGMPGHLLSVDRTVLADVWDELVSAGATPVGAEAFHAARIEARFPLYGLDLSADNLAQEANRTQQAISFRKGCYLGQEPIARIDSVGHINRELCPVRISSAVVPEPGAAVVSGEGRPVGVITSAAGVPSESRSVALACVRTSHSQAETEVAVLTEAGRLAARIG